MTQAPSQQGASQQAARVAAAPGWGIYEIARQPDPYPAWAALRERHPVLDAGDGVYFVTSWALVDRAVRDPKLCAGSGVTRSLAREQGRAVDVSRLWLMALDGPPHDRARGLVRRPFAARRVAAMGGLVRELADSLVADFVARACDAPANFASEVALRLPSQVIRRLFEIDAEVWEREVQPLFGGGAEGADAGPATGDLIERLADFFARERARATGGLLAALQAPGDDGEVLSADEVVANAVLLATAAIDTTTGLVANALACLLRRPDVLARVRADASLVPAVVEETLRFEPPALSCSRHAPEPTELGGVAIPAGSHLLLGIGAANRDPARYPRPDVFDIDRDPTGLLTFGGGRHFCLGAALARLEARAVLEALLAHMRAHAVELELAGPIVWRDDNPTVRAPRELRVRARPARAGRSA